MKYKIDDIIIINDREWRVAGHNFRFGKEWQYTLLFEHTDGSFDSIHINEKSLDSIVMQEPQGEDPGNIYSKAKE